jgi:hypothetical protein
MMLRQARGLSAAQCLSYSVKLPLLQCGAGLAPPRHQERRIAISQVMPEAVLTSQPVVLESLHRDGHSLRRIAGADFVGGDLQGIADLHATQNATFLECYNRVRNI